MSAPSPALVEALRELLDLIKQHRVAGDGDLDAVLARVESVLAYSNG